MIQFFGLATFVTTALITLAEHALLIRIWSQKTQWAEESDFHEPSWVTTSPRRRWRFFFAIIRFDRHLRTNICDACLLVTCWVANFAMFVSFGGLIGALATTTS